MPELPEVETIVRTLKPIISGLEVERIDLFYRPLLRYAAPAELKSFCGREITKVYRRGKLVIIEFAGGRKFAIHLKMTGQLYVTSVQEPPDKHTRLIVEFKDANKKLYFRDVRKFGFVLCLREGNEAEASELSSLGREPLDISPVEFRNIFKGRRGRLKSLLLNQTLLAGIGNIYADEILFEAGLHPQSAGESLSEENSRRLYRAMRRVLLKAIEKGGSSIRDYVDGRGNTGSFQHLHRVYGREGQPCRRCRAPIKRIRVAGRSSYFCPACQVRK